MEKQVCPLIAMGVTAEGKVGPLHAKCLGQVCAWWVSRYNQIDKTFEKGCAINLLAHSPHKQIITRSE